MKISDHVYALPLTAMMGGGPSTLFLALIVDDLQGATLVDTGIPGMKDKIGAALSEIGMSLSDIRRVIITHHDLDHIGSLPAIVEATGARVLTSAGELPYVQGELPGQKQPTPEMRAGMSPQMLAVFDNPPKAQVDQVLEDGERLDLAGGVRIVYTPGHTVGHLSLFVEADGVVISGDALGSNQGTLTLPWAQGTADMPEAVRSVAKLAQLPAEAILTYHGGLVSENAAQQLQTLAAQQTA
ncbi:MBL fold metallo-hydrolase [Deinococcus aquatilis]|jgi:glyoxylase-like metal-dependent hydrolase (beta-lactamase superfamily II)|uniref:MBL fold metallo-hydrolase n=1 Tax=Deinococcus aquatilis TaxID=519440 RepID=UPI0003758261|nr:MBL fold metallo-hydrolase [Deinococcus aquatilis]